MVTIPNLVLAEHPREIMCAGGLAALAGGWEGSDELVETVLELRPTPGRSAPALDFVDPSIATG